MRTSNMTEGGPKSSTQKRKKSTHIAPLPVPAPGSLPPPCCLSILTEVLLAALLCCSLVRCPFTQRANCGNYLVFWCRLPLSPVAGPFSQLVSHISLLHIVVVVVAPSGRLSKLPALHAQRCVSTAYQTYPSIHPFIRLSTCQ